QAVGGYRHALDLLRRLPPDAARDAREMSLQSELMTSLYATDGPGAAELETIAARIDSLSRSGKTTPALLTSLFGLIAFCITRADLGRAEEACQRALQRAAEMESGAFFAEVARGLFGFIQHRRGLLAAAVPNLEAGAALPLIGASGMMEPSTACASDLGFTLLLMGELRRGLEMMRALTRPAIRRRSSTRRRTCCASARSSKIARSSAPSPPRCASSASVWRHLALPPTHAWPTAGCKCVTVTPTASSSSERGGRF